jgi:ribose 5-phosphate isomerase B
MRLAFGSDHGGIQLKETIKTYIQETRKDIDIIDLGTNSDDSVDYPEFGQKVARAILDGSADQGILCCGTGIGISMAANRFKGIRAAVVTDEFMAEMAKAHNNANILCLGGRTTSEHTARRFVDIWLDTKFEGERHQRRLDKLDQL